MIIFRISFQRRIIQSNFLNQEGGMSSHWQFQQNHGIFSESATITSPLEFWPPHLSQLLQFLQTLLQYNLSRTYHLFFFWSGGVDLQHSSARFSFKRCSGIFSACNGLKSRPDFDQWAEHYHQVHWEKNMKTRQRYHMLVHWHL